MTTLQFQVVRHPRRSPVSSLSDTLLIRITGVVSDTGERVECVCEADLCHPCQWPAPGTPGRLRPLPVRDTGRHLVISYPGEEVSVPHPEEGEWECFYRRLRGHLDGYPPASVRTAPSPSSPEYQMVTLTGADGITVLLPARRATSLPHPHRDLPGFCRAIGWGDQLITVYLLGRQCPPPSPATIPGETGLSVRGIALLGLYVPGSRGAHCLRLGRGQLAGLWSQLSAPRPSALQH